MSGLTVFFHKGVERTYTDEVDLEFTTSITDGHLSINETLRLLPGGEHWRKPRTINVFPPGIWREVEFDYER